MQSTVKPVGKELQCSFRLGKYGICQIPLNIVLGEIGFDGKFNERLIQSTKTYHKSYETAMEALYDRFLNDKMSKSNMDHVKTIIKSIKEAKEEILSELRST